MKLFIKYYDHQFREKLMVEVSPLSTIKAVIDESGERHLLPVKHVEREFRKNREEGRL